jgi:hypothetical protein
MIPLPFQPGGLQYQGAMADNGGMLQLINALSTNGAAFVGQPSRATVVLTTGLLVTAQQHLATEFVYTGSGGALSNQWASAAVICAALPMPYIGMEFPWLVVNNTNGTVTNVTGAGITTTGTLTIPTLAFRKFWMKVTACAVSITSLSYANGTVTIGTNLPHGLAAAGTAVTLGLINAAFNGSFTIATVPDSYHLTFPLAASTAFATDNTMPNPTIQRPAVLNTAAAMTAITDWAIVTAITSA